MRLGVLDIGSNTVHLLVVDAHRGARPIPAYSHKEELRLSEHLDEGDNLSAEGVERLGAFVEEAVRIAEDKGVEDLLAFATSAVREAANGERVLAEIDERCGVHIDVLSGRDEARLTFLAVRRWFGWSSGRLLVFDIGGGSLEIASGVDEEPDVAVSLPLGAGRLTRDRLTEDRPPPRRCGVCASTSGPRSPARSGPSSDTAGPTGRWRPPRRSSSSPGSPGRRPRVTASTSRVR
jgi:exopolyphosphatase/guanosine-5'-triphosphate,3'-diphosphate pyrophosphatase